MPACTVIREASGDTATYMVSGRFESACAWDLAGRLAQEKLPCVVLELSRCQDFHDYAIAVLAQALLGMAGKQLALRGLRQHQERVFKCFGVDVGELAHAGRPAEDLAKGAPAREVG